MLLPWKWFIFLRMKFRVFVPPNFLLHRPVHLNLLIALVIYLYCRSGFNILVTFEFMVIRLPKKDCKIHINAVESFIFVYMIFFYFFCIMIWLLGRHYWQGNLWISFFIHSYTIFWYIYIHGKGWSKKQRTLILHSPGQTKVSHCELKKNKSTDASAFNIYLIREKKVQQIYLIRKKKGQQKSALVMCEITFWQKWTSVRKHLLSYEMSSVTTVCF